MKIIYDTLILVRKESKSELKNIYSLASVFLYVAAIIIVLYLALSSQGAAEKMEVKYWNVLFWMMLLFSAIQTISKSFIQENTGRYLYYYSLVSPTSVILSKLIYNSLLMLCISLLSALLYSVVLGSPVQQFAIYFLVLFLASLSFSLLFTIISAIASKAGNAALTAVLGLPLIVVLLIYIMKISREAFFQSYSENFFLTLGIILLFDLMLVILSLILFPYLWRD